MKLKPKLGIGLTALCVCIAALGCESKFSESSPSSVKTEGIPLEERIVQKGKIDSQIEEIQQAGEQLKKILEMFKQIQNPSTTTDVYTPLDFLLDASRELKDKIPVSQNSQLMQYGKIEVPVGSLSGACRTIETALESSSIASESSPEKLVGERLVYSFKTCDSQDYLQVAVAETKGNTLELKIITKNLGSIFNDLAGKATQDSVCNVIQDTDHILQSIQCHNFTVALSKSEVAQVKGLAFNNSGDIRFEAYADIFENGVLKATSEIQYMRNGDVKSNLKKVDPAPVSQP